MNIQHATEPFDYELPLLKKDPEIGRRPAHEYSAPCETVEDAEKFKKVQVWVTTFSIFLLGLSIGYFAFRHKGERATIEPQNARIGTKSLTTQNAVLADDLHNSASIVHPSSSGKEKTELPKSTRPVRPPGRGDRLWTKHVITPGETLHTLSCKYDVTIATIIQQNGGAFVPRVGHSIKMPEAQFPQHTVQKGETLYGISATIDVPVQTLIQLNGIKGNRIKINQILRTE